MPGCKALPGVENFPVLQCTVRSRTIPLRISFCRPLDPYRLHKSERIVRTCAPNLPIGRAFAHLIVQHNRHSRQAKADMLLSGRYDRHALKPSGIITALRLLYHEREA